MDTQDHLHKQAEQPTEGALKGLGVLLENSMLTPLDHHNAGDLLSASLFRMLTKLSLNNQPQSDQLL